MTIRYQNKAARCTGSICTLLLVQQPHKTGACVHPRRLRTDLASREWQQQQWPRQLHSGHAPAQMAHNLVIRALSGSHAPILLKWPPLWPNSLRMAGRP